MWHGAFLFGSPWTASLWHDLFHLQVPWPEKIVRAIAVYAFLLVAIRVFGRRELGQLTATDIIVLLTISNILQNAMIGNDNSLLGGIIGALTLLGANLGVAYALFRSRRLERMVNGDPRILIVDGKIQQRAVKAELLTEQDLISVIHREGLERMEDVHLAIAEPNGMISVIPKNRDRASP